jgi:protein-tyrosine phosphatase
MRSDAPIRLGAAGPEALTALGLRTAIDLREPVERRRDPVDPQLAEHVEVVSHPLIDRRVDLRVVTGLATVYSHIVARCGDRFAAIVELLAAPGALPAVFFCSAGKDRTGLTTAIVLSALGVDEEAVAADYAATARVMHGAFRDEVEARALAVGLTEQALAVGLGAPRQAILDVLATVRAEHGDTAAYLREHGASPAALDRLRAQLVDGAPTA